MRGIQRLRLFWNGGPTAASLPRRLDAPRRDVPPLRSVLWMLAGLLLLAFVPRAIMAWKLDTICSDGVLYIHLARAFAARNYDVAFGSSMGLNLYPMILALLHGGGLDWELAGKCWGVLAATLVVLPLFGWLRRLFDERTALIGCAIYAVHPKLIEWSPELVRDPTFWLLLSLAVYFCWRAVSESRAWFIFAASCASLLAVLTRFEGLFLLFPALGWSLWRIWYSPESRRGIGMGLLISGACIPLVLVVVNFTLLRDHTRFELFGIAPAVRLEHFVEAVFGGSAPAVPVAGGQEASRMSMPTMTWVYLDGMQRGLSPFFALLMFGGIWTWRRLWVRIDHQPIFWLGVAVSGGAWIHLWQTQEISSRYALSIVVLGSGFAALELVSLARMLARLTKRLAVQAAVRPSAGWILGGLLVLLGIFGWADALSSHYGSRQARASVGRTIRQRFGPASRIVGSTELKSLVSYYASASYMSLPGTADDSEFAEFVGSEHPDAVVLAAHRKDAMRRSALITVSKRMGYEEVKGLRPYVARHVVLLVRSPEDRLLKLQVAEKSNQSTR